LGGTPDWGGDKTSTGRASRGAVSAHGDRLAGKVHGVAGAQRCGCAAALSLCHASRRLAL